MLLFLFWRTGQRKIKKTTLNFFVFPLSNVSLWWAPPPESNQSRADWRNRPKNRKGGGGKIKIGYLFFFLFCYRFKIEKKSNHTLYKQRRHTRKKKKSRRPEALFLERWSFSHSSVGWINTHGYRRWIERESWMRHVGDKPITLA